MSLFGKLFNKKQEIAQDLPNPFPPDPANDPSLIRVFDKYGQKLFITRDQWRLNVLPATIQSQSSNPAQLCRTIVSALNHGFTDDLPGAAEQLHRIDPGAASGACA